MRSALANRLFFRFRTTIKLPWLLLLLLFPLLPAPYNPHIHSSHSPRCLFFCPLPYSFPLQLLFLHFFIMSATSTLTAQDRNRLMRSTRKLGRLLGTVPHLEVSPQQQQRQRPSINDVITISANTAVSPPTPTSPITGNRNHHILMSLKALEAGDEPHGQQYQRSHSPTPPVICVHTCPSSSPRQHQRRRSSVSSTTSTYPSRRMHSVYEPLNEDDDAEMMEEKRRLQDIQRRRKMAKLARTLGENVPPELVFHHDQQQQQQQEKRRMRRRSRSVGNVPIITFSSLDELDEKEEEHVGEHRQQQMRSSMESDETVVVVNVVAPDLKAEQLETAETFITPLARSESLPVPPPRSRSPFGLKQVFASSRPSLDTSSSLAPPTSKRTKTKGSDGAGRRKEREWSGEWNTSDMELVRSTLRELKAR